MRTSFLALAFAIAAISVAMFSSGRAVAAQPSLELQVPQVVLSAGSYEYQVSSKPDFASENLVRNGNGSLKEISLDLEPGLYFVRYRPRHDKNAAASPSSSWTAPQKVVVSSSKPFITAPLEGEKIEVASERDELRFEWWSVPGADEYEAVLVSPTAGKKNFRSDDPFVEAKGLAAGRWKLKVNAYSKSQLISESAELEFEVVSDSTPRPQILQPRLNEVLPADEQTRVRWKNKGGSRSVDVIIRLIDEKGARHVESRERVSNNEDTILPALPPGQYELSIVARGAKGVSASRAFKVANVNFVQSAPEPTLRGYFLGTFALARRSMNNPYLEDAHVEGMRAGYVAGLAEVGGELRVSRKLYMELGLISEFYNYVVPSGMTTESNPTPVDVASIDGPSGGGARLGFRYREDVWGPRFPTEFRLLAEYRYIRHYVPGQNPDPSSSDLYLKSTNFGILLMGLGIDVTWIPRRGAFRFLLGSVIDIPVLHEQGLILGTGKVQPLPSLSVHVLARRDLTEHLYFMAGLDLRAELLGVSEEGGGSTTLRSIIVGPQFGLGAKF